MPRPTLRAQPYAVPAAVAHSYIGLSRATFDQYRREGKIPAPNQATGTYRLADLEACFEAIESCAVDVEAERGAAALDLLLRQA